MLFSWLGDRPNFSFNFFWFMVYKKINFLVSWVKKWVTCQRKKKYQWRKKFNLLTHAQKNSKIINGGLRLATWPPKLNFLDLEADQALLSTVVWSTKSYIFWPMPKNTTNGGRIHQLLNQNWPPTCTLFLLRGRSIFRYQPFEFWSTRSSIFCTNGGKISICWPMPKKYYKWRFAFVNFLTKTDLQNALYFDCRFNFSYNFLEFWPTKSSIFWPVQKKTKQEP